MAPVCPFVCLIYCQINVHFFLKLVISYISIGRFATLGFFEKLWLMLQGVKMGKKHPKMAKTFIFAQYFIMLPLIFLRFAENVETIVGPPTLVGLGPYNSPSSVRAFQLYSVTTHWIFLKFCMELQLYRGENVTFSDFWK